MSTTVYITPAAASQLRAAYAYLNTHSGKAAESLLNGFEFKVDLLTRAPEVGQKLESPFTSRVYRYLILTNYKIIYAVEQEGVFIHAFFDARQHPSKLSLPT